MQSGCWKIPLHWLTNVSGARGREHALIHRDFSHFGDNCYCGWDVSRLQSTQMSCVIQENKGQSGGKSERWQVQGSSGNSIQVSSCTGISIRDGIVVSCWGLHSNRGLERCQYEGVDFSLQGLIWRLIQSLWEFSTIIRQSPFPVGSDAAGMFFLQSCQAVLTTPKPSPESDGVTCLWSPSFPLSLEVEYFPLQCRGSQFLLSQNPTAQPCLVLCVLTSDAN